MPANIILFKAETLEEVWIMFTVSNKNIRKMPLALFWCFDN